MAKRTYAPNFGMCVLCHQISTTTKDENIFPNSNWSHFKIGCFKFANFWPTTLRICNNIIAEPLKVLQALTKLSKALISWISIISYCQQLILTVASFQSRCDTVSLIPALPMIHGLWRTDSCGCHKLHQI